MEYRSRNTGWLCGVYGVLLSIIICTGCSEAIEKEMTRQEERVVRETCGDGRWFPAGGAQLGAAVRGYMNSARVPGVEGRIVAAIAPHAGYVYSGGVAGYTFRALRENARSKGAPDTAVVLGLLHRGGFPGVALMDGDAVASPLGEAALDKEAGDFLVGQSKKIFFDHRPHRGEHSAENEIPFVQASLPDTAMVVGIIGDHNTNTIDELVGALLELSKKKKIVVIASTDLLHHADYSLVTRTDKATLEKISALDHGWLSTAWGYRNQICCGIGPVLTAVRFAEAMGCEKGTTLYYRNSGDDHPESRGSWVVGYGAVVFSVP